MDRTTLTDFFEEVETTEEYNGYFCSIAEAIGIVVLGSLCGLKNVSQIHQWAESERVSEFLKEKFAISHISCCYWLLALLKMVKTDTLNQCLMKWAARFLPKGQSQTAISLDGKTIRSTTGMKHMDSPLHIISAPICELGITLAFVRFWKIDFRELLPKTLSFPVNLWYNSCQATCLLANKQQPGLRQYGIRAFFVADKHHPDSQSLSVLTG